MTAPDLSPAEQAIVDRFESAPDGLDESDLVVTVTPTIMSGTVVRWFADLEAAERYRPFLSASAYEVITHMEGVVTPALRQQADAVHEALKVDKIETVRHLATHRRTSLVGPFVPVGGDSP